MTDLSDFKYNFEFSCHFRGVNVPDYSRFLVLVPITMFYDNFQEFSFSFDILQIQSSFVCLLRVS